MQDDAAEWDAHLTALEAWVVRVERTVAGSPLDLPDPPAPPSGPLPPALGLRARALLARMEAATAAGARRRQSLDRGRAYQVDPGD